jgi:thioredoxin 1
MSKFGELIDDKLPLLLVFYNAEDQVSSSMHPILKDVAAAMGDKGKVIKIDAEKNIKLSDALRVKVLPTLMIYKLGEMVWRQSGEQDANTLISSDARSPGLVFQAVFL